MATKYSMVFSKTFKYSDGSVNIFGLLPAEMAFVGNITKFEIINHSYDYEYNGEITTATPNTTVWGRYSDDSLTSEDFTASNPMPFGYNPSYKYINSEKSWPVEFRSYAYLNDNPVQTDPDIVTFNFEFEFYDAYPNDTIIKGFVKDLANNPIENSFVEIETEATSYSYINYEDLTDNTGYFEMNISPDAIVNAYENNPVYPANIFSSFVTGATPDNQPTFSNTMEFQEITDLGDIIIDSVNTAITTAQELFDIRFHPFGNFTLENDIDLSGFQVPSYCESDSREVQQNPDGYFYPIMDYYNNNYDICIQIDGKNYSITNFYYKRNANTGINYMGLFGSFRYEAMKEQKNLIKNLNLKNIYLGDDSTANTYAGGLAIDLEDTAVENVQVSGTIENVYAVGGISSSISENWFDGISVDKISFTGNITARNEAAGLYRYAGYTYDSGIETKNSFVKATIEAPNKVAGFSLTVRDHHYFKNCYSASTLISDGTISILAPSAESFEKCYYDSDLLGEVTVDYAEGIARTTEQMTYPYQEIESYLGWDFSSLPDPANYDYPDTVDFANDSIEKIMNKTNDGYPELGPPSIIWFAPPVWISTGIGLVEFGGNFFWVKKNDTWNPAEGFVKNGGSWHPITLADVKKGGSWD